MAVRPLSSSLSLKSIQSDRPTMPGTSSADRRRFERSQAQGASLPRRLRLPGASCQRSMQAVLMHDAGCTCHSEDVNVLLPLSTPQISLQAAIPHFNGHIEQLGPYESVCCLKHDCRGSPWRCFSSMTARRSALTVQDLCHTPYLSSNTPWRRMCNNSESSYAGAVNLQPREQRSQTRQVLLLQPRTCAQ